MTAACGRPLDSFYTLPGSLPFDSSELSEFEDFLAVPQHDNDFCLSSASSLSDADLFRALSGFEGSSETTSSFSSPASADSSRLSELASAFSLDLDQPPEQAPIAAQLPLGTHGLKLKLDCLSVMSAWQGMPGGGHPFQLRGALLSAAASAIPSTADLAASLATATAPVLSLPATSDGSGSAADGAGPCEGPEEALRQDSVARYREKKHRKSGERKVVYPARKVNADKRPRIKGRFVTKAEFQVKLCPSVSHDRAVPGLMCA